MAEQTEQRIRPEDWDGKGTDFERHQELAARDLMARTLGEGEPLSVAEHLELVASGVSTARYVAHPAHVDRALQAGASWEEIAAALGTNAYRARAEHRAWADGQRRLHADHGVGLDETEYAAALAQSRAALPAAKLPEEHQAQAAMALTDATERRKAAQEAEAAATEDVHRGVLEALEVGVTTRRAAELGGVSLDTVARWSREARNAAPLH